MSVLLNSSEILWCLAPGDPLTDMQPQAAGTKAGSRLHLAQNHGACYHHPRDVLTANTLSVSPDEKAHRKLGEKKLAATLPKLHKDILAVRQALKKTLDEVKPAKKELRTSDEILMKSENAYKLFGARIEQSREKARLARQQEQELRMGAMLAERASQQLKTKANASSNKNEAAMLLQESKEQSSKADMYRKQADESVQTAQLLEAEADEAASYMSMFGSDLTQASMRRKQALGKLEFLSQQYQRGSLLEQAAVQKERALAYQMNNAEHSLTQDRKELKQDEAALATGEKATAKTVTELNVDKKSAVQNYKGAIADLTKIRQDKAKYVRDAEQAMEVENQAFAHNQASEHLKLASEAAAAEIKK
eukprot:763519-Hanusia_phi.AAC.6